MVPLKEDGSLDCERIDNLPFDEHVELLGELSDIQADEYFSRQIIRETKRQIQATKVDYTIEDEIKRGCIIAEDYINNKIKEYES